MSKAILTALISLFLASNGADKPPMPLQPQSTHTQTGTLEKLIVQSGSVAMEIDLQELTGSKAPSQLTRLNFAIAPDSFFTILVFNGELRGPESGSMGITPQGSALSNSALNAYFNSLVIEKTDWNEPFELVVRDARTGFTLFNIEGNIYDYNAATQLLSVMDGRLLLSKEFAAKLGRPKQEGTVAGTISSTATLRPIEIMQLVNGEVRSSTMPPVAGLAPTLEAGPDVIVGSLTGLAQFGATSGTQIGLAMATTSCNAGVEPLHWFALPNNDHPVIMQNLYRMSGGASNNDRFEQVGQASLKHAFTTLEQNICEFGCQHTDDPTLLGGGCSDPYSATLNSGGAGNALGSRAWVNPFTGARKQLLRTARVWARSLTTIPRQPFRLTT